MKSQFFRFTIIFATLFIGTAASEAPESYCEKSFEILKEATNEVKKAQKSKDTYMMHRYMQKAWDLYADLATIADSCDCQDAYNIIDECYAYCRDAVKSEDWMKIRDNAFECRELEADIRIQLNRCSKEW
jgi:hypothetical protein